jgi:hypothetical protein
MKPAFAILAAVLLLGGCAGHAATSQVATPTPHLQTYASRPFRSAVTFDAGRLTARVEPDASGHNLTLLLPGVGQVRGDVLTIIVTEETSANLPGQQRGQISWGA